MPLPPPLLGRAICGFPVATAAEGCCCKRPSLCGGLSPRVRPRAALAATYCDCCSRCACFLPTKLRTVVPLNSNSHGTEQHFHKGTRQQPVARYAPVMTSVVLFLASTESSFSNTCRSWSLGQREVRGPLPSNTRLSARPLLRARAAIAPGITVRVLHSQRRLLQAQGRKIQHTSYQLCNNWCWAAVLLRVSILSSDRRCRGVGAQVVRTAHPRTSWSGHCSDAHEAFDQVAALPSVQHRPWVHRLPA